MGRIETLTWILITLLIAPLFAFTAVNYLPQFDGFTVTGGSMEPEIKTGSLLFTHNVEAEKIEVGDTITFRDGDHFTTHKVISKNSDNGEVSFRTQGIANESPDPGIVTEDELRGRKLVSIPLLGYFIAWAGTTQGLLIVVVLPGTLLILLEAKNIVDEFRKEQ